MLNTEQLMKLKKAATGVFLKNAVLRNFAIFTGKHPCEIFKNTYLKKICVQLLLN